MSMILKARIIEGTDVWYDSVFQDNSSQHSFVKINNDVLSIDALCDQKGYNALYNIGKALWKNGTCSKFEIAAFDNDNLFWKTRPDKWNFERGRYSGWFDSMIAEELKSFHSEDFQNDPLETGYLSDYQKRFWDNKSIHFSPDGFHVLLEDTELYHDIATVYEWIETKESELPVSDLADDNIIPHHCGFVHNGQLIINPFYDPTCRFEVEPVSYYGKENIKQYVRQVKEHTAAHPQKHKALDDQIQAAELQKINLPFNRDENTLSVSREEL